MFKSIFTDSKIASSYACAKTKTFTILNEAFAPHCLDYIVQHCKTDTYSVGHDGSNDTGIQKMNPISIRAYIQQTFPIEDEVICNSVWIDVENRISC